MSGSLNLKLAACAPRAAFALLGLLLIGCLPENPTEGTEADGIQLSGRVMGSGSQPLEGVVVSLANTGLTDTTDALGQYSLRRQAAASNHSYGALDTLLFKQRGRKLFSLRVNSWIENLPDINIMQRDISGLLSPASFTISKIEAVVYPEGAGPGDSLTTPFFYNPLTSNYSGFVYFPPEKAITHYFAYVNIYGDDGRLMGRSVTVPFNSLAGDLTIPKFNPANAVPASL